MDKNERMARSYSKGAFRQHGYEPKYFPVAVVDENGRADQRLSTTKMWKPDALQSLCQNMQNTAGKDSLHVGHAVVVYRHRMFIVVQKRRVEQDYSFPVYEWTIVNRFSKRQKEAAIMAMVMISGRG